MPGLLTLHTDLKSLKYGQDQPDGGSSNQPYIKTDINSIDATINKVRLTKFDDGLIRGGAVGAINASVTDTLRIGKFFVDFSKGPLFLVKQVGLQLSNPQLEHIDTLPTNRRGTNKPIKHQGFLRNATNAITNAATAVGAFVSNVSNKIENAIGPTRIYNLGVNTLAQVPINAIGGHILRHGLLPTNDPDKLYMNVVKVNNFQNDHNRLEGYASTFGLGGFGSAGNWDSTSTEITNYIGGPSSVYGIGSTSIRRSYDAITNNWDKINESLDFGKIATSNSYPSIVLSNNIVATTATSSSLLEQTLSQFSIFKPASSITDYMGAYSKSIQQFNTLIGRQVVNARNAANSPNTSTAQTSTSAPSTQTTANSPIVATTSVYSFRPSTEIKGDDTNRTWRTKEEMGEILNTSFDRVTNIELNLGTVSGSTGIQSQLPNRFLGASYLDPGVKALAKQATIYDNTAVPYSDVHPALRKFSELTAAIEATTVSGSDYKMEYATNLGILPSSTENPIYTNGYGDVVKVGIPWNKATREVRVGSGRKDEINLTPIFTSGNYDGSDTVGTHNIRDLVKFRIQAVNTDGPGSGDWMVFRAYLTDLSDSVDANWNEVKYAGRGDKFWIYDSFTRKISISFKVAALSSEEMKPMYQKLNFLMSNLMPDYKGVLMRGPLIRLTVGNYIDSQLGKLDSLSYKVPQDSPWEIAIDEPENGVKSLILPHIIEVTLGFTPIGSDSHASNELQRKSQTISHIAQNNTGDTQLQYIG
jgi:hypothetical protein